MTTGDDRYDSVSPSRRGADGVIVLGVAYLLVRAFWMLSGAAGRAFDSASIEATAKIVLWGCGCFPIALWLARRNDTTVGAMFGIGNGVWRGAALGLGATLPMIAALFVLPLKRFDLDLALGSGVLGPLAEEFLFRGFLFGLLWRGAGWSPLASIVASSLLFGLAHLPRADFELWHILRGPDARLFEWGSRGGEVVYFRSGEAAWLQFVQARLPAIAATVVPLAAGGAVLAWVAYRWNSLWSAIALHGCMNLWWDLTRGEHARPTLGPDLMSVAQVLSVALAILISLRFSTSGPHPSSPVVTRRYLSSPVIPD